jgi:hypothetical protein
LSFDHSDPWLLGTVGLDSGGVTSTASGAPDERANVPRPTDGPESPSTAIANAVPATASKASRLQFVPAASSFAATGVRAETLVPR